MQSPPADAAVRAGRLVSCRKGGISTDKHIGCQSPKPIISAVYERSRPGTHSINNHRPKNRPGNFLPVLGVLGAAHHAVVAVGEHAADGAEDHDREEGDYYAGVGVEGLDGY
jgi:hypothetical protein